jgi:molybdopterin-guanine dinucleotide biosynthesis protein
MDSGKTTACTALIHALSRAGLRVGAAKLTGTASARDLSSYRDAGAEPVVDFLDCGWESTAGCSAPELKQISRTLAAELRSAAVDVAVVEVADGITQPETRALLDDLQRSLTDPSVIFTARESLAATAGAERLTALGYRVRAISGVVTSSPLAVREVELEAKLPCVRTCELGRHAIELGWFTGVPAAPRELAATA